MVDAVTLGFIGAGTMSARTLARVCRSGRRGGEQSPRVAVADGVENTKIVVALPRSLTSGIVEQV